MRDVPMNKILSNHFVMNLRSAALISLIIVLPFVLLEVVNQTVTWRNAPGLFVLFGLLWLLPVSLIVILLSCVRAVRTETSRGNPFNILFKIAVVILIAAVWGNIMIDQMPCFLGVPNCD